MSKNYHPLTKVFGSKGVQEAGSVSLSPDLNSPGIQNLLHLFQSKNESIFLAILFSSLSEDSSSNKPGSDFSSGLSSTV